MRIALFLAAALAATPALAQDEPRPAAYTNAEACLRDNVAAAVQAGSGAADAADFLLTYLCAGPVNAAAAYQRNTASLATMKKMFAGMHQMSADMDDEMVTTAAATAAAAAAAAAASTAPVGDEVKVDLVPLSTQDSTPDMFGWFDGASVDPVTGEIVMDPAKEATFGAAFGSQLSTVNQVGGDLRPVFLRELAGRLVLEQHR